MKGIGILLQAAPAGDSSGFGMEQIIMFGAIGLVFYFFMIRPQMKKQKEAKQFKESLVKGSKIITIGGIHGKIVEIKDDTVMVEVEGGNRMKLEKSAISKEFAAEEMEQK
ncbi:MAG: preprotein translocase subunit YajC [Flavobacteriales bacterium]|jgi:preprotein translocase subunit YajC|tara:strand:+ start:4543 stop:4872 length:330 start_codon:yes stop_codon:yes gene_type:complete